MVLTVTSSTLKMVYKVVCRRYGRVIASFLAHSTEQALTHLYSNRELVRPLHGQSISFLLSESAGRCCNRLEQHEHHLVNY